MNTVYIIFEDGKVTTIKSHLALTIATGFIQDWFSLKDFIVLPVKTEHEREFYFIHRDVEITDILLQAKGGF